eukprot:Nk52_evm4s1945 gene=Nk52_evmTU4s1945
MGKMRAILCIESKKLTTEMDGKIKQLNQLMMLYGTTAKKNLEHLRETVKVKENDLEARLKKIGDNIESVYSMGCGDNCRNDQTQANEDIDASYAQSSALSESEHHHKGTLFLNKT